MKTWNSPVVDELTVASTEESGNTPTASDKNYKAKTNQCECTHNTNFAFSREHFESDTHTPS